MRQKSEEAPLTRRDVVLFFATVFAWSASWYALKVNSGFAVAPPVSTFWRFALAAVFMLGFVALTGRRLRFGSRMHAAFALIGVFLFSTNFILFYHASELLVSGLLAVVFFLAAIFNLASGALRGELAGPRRWFGAALGVSGIALMYWPAVKGGGGSVGLALCVFGTLSFCIGNQIIQAVYRLDDVPVMSAVAWGMLYGASWCAIVSLAVGFPFTFAPAAGYVLSLLFVALISTLLAFWAYLNLLRSNGAGRAAYATVMFTVFALLLSTVLESYVWTPLAVAGVMLALTGNLFVLRSARRRGVALPSPVV